MLFALPVNAKIIIMPFPAGEGNALFVEGRHHYLVFSHHRVNLRRVNFLLDLGTSSEISLCGVLLVGPVAVFQGEPLEAVSWCAGDPWPREGK